MRSKTIGNITLEDIPNIPEDIKSIARDYQDIRSHAFVDWLPDGSGMLVATKLGNTTQLYIVKKAGDNLTPVTSADEPVSSASYCPDPNKNGLIFGRDQGGNEYTQFYWHHTQTKNTTLISDGTSVNSYLKWSNKGDKFAFTSTRRNNKNFDIYVSSTANPQQTNIKISQSAGKWVVNDWSPDDSQILVTRHLSNTQSDAFIFNLITNKLTALNGETENGLFTALGWNSQTTKIYVITDQDREFKTLAEYDLASGKIDYITGNVPWDVENFTLNKTRNKAAFIVNQNGLSQLYLKDTKTNRFEKIPNLPKGKIYSIGFHPHKNQLAITLTSNNLPGDIYVLNLDNYQNTRWTHDQGDPLDISDLPEPESITYETFDQTNHHPRLIPAFIYKPKSPQKPLPVVILIHGGPEAQHIPSFSPLIACLVNELGIAVIAPNVRGSTGYGKSYTKLDDQYLREDAVKDIGQLIEWISKNSEFDAKKIAVYGGSYGGYMVLASMVHFGQAIKCGIDIVGISNFVTFLENTKPYRQNLRRPKYGDEREADMRTFLTAISPTTNAHQITKPLLIIQGANDPRVPVTESEQMVSAIRQNQTPVWYMLAHDEGHGFRKKENQITMLETIILFLRKNLL